MAQTLPPALEQELQKFDTMRRNYEQLQMILQQLKQEIAEVTTTVEELKKQPDDVVTYKTVGQVMFLVKKPELVEEFGNREKTLKVQLDKYNNDAQTMSEKLKELQEKLQAELQTHNLRMS